MFEIDDATRRTCSVVRQYFESMELNYDLPKGLSTAMICMTPRSGSTYLGSLFRENGLGDAKEHLRIAGNQMRDFVNQCGAKSYGDFIRALVEGYASSNYFSIKADWLQFRPFYHFGGFQKYFQNAKFIYLSRKDILSQAISHFIAGQTGYGHTTQIKDSNKFELLQFDYKGILAEISEIQSRAKAWEMFFSLERIEPLRLYYEDLRDNPAGTLTQIVAFLNVELPKVPTLDTEYRSVETHLNHELRQKFIGQFRREQLEVGRHQSNNPTKS